MQSTNSENRLPYLATSCNFSLIPNQYLLVKGKQVSFHLTHRIYRVKHSVKFEVDFDVSCIFCDNYSKNCGSFVLFLRQFWQSRVVPVSRLCQLFHIEKKNICSNCTHVRYS